MSDDLTKLPEGWKPATFTHTPGPWRAGPTQTIPAGQQVLILAGPPGQTWGVCSVQIANMDDAGVQSANARLIAAAPDLLEALKLVLAASDEAEVTGEWEPLNDPSLWDTLRAAIAKAEGR